VEVHDPAVELLTWDARARSRNVTIEERYGQTEEAPMFQRFLTSKLKNISRMRLSFISATVLLLNGLLLAQQTEKKTFASPEEAIKALFAAALSDDQAALLEIFGPEGNEIISAGDHVEDKNTLGQFVAKYREMHRLVKEPDGTATLYIGAENWPLPVPLVDESGLWHFDTEAGKKEIFYRRVGENEYGAISVCHALVEAENDYYSQSRDGQVQQYAQVLVSDEGKHNGLFWKTGDGQPESPIGSLLAYAAGASDGKPQEYENSPFHGYYYRILTGRGKTADGDANSYIVNGKMTGGFAILAYPADHRASGLMTFVVNQTGVVYEKDLGDETTEVAGAMKEYAPDETWKKAE
jgi:hypothetical protein